MPQPTLGYIYDSIMEAIDHQFLEEAFDEDLPFSIKAKKKSLEIKIGKRTFTVVIAEVK